MPKSLALYLRISIETLPNVIDNSPIFMRSLIDITTQVIQIFEILIFIYLIHFKVILSNISGGKKTQRRC